MGRRGEQNKCNIRAGDCSALPVVSESESFQNNNIMESFMVMRLFRRSIILLAF